MANEPRVVVIGAGIVGASIAFHLSLRTPNVMVLDADAPGMAASYASYGWVNARLKTPRGYHALSRRSLEVWPRFERRLGGDVGITWGGELRWTVTDAGAHELRSEVSLMQSWGYPTRLISPGELRALEPGLAAGPVTAAAWSEHEFHVDVEAVVARCLHEAAARGATLRSHTPVTAIATETVANDLRVLGVETAAGSFKADVVVLAAGYPTRGLAASIGLEYPQTESPGATVLTAPLPPLLESVACLHTPRDLPDPQMNIRQLRDGRLQVHGGSQMGSVDGDTPEDARPMLDALAEFLPAISGAPVEGWRKAMRPMPGDGLPIIGFPRHAPGLYFASMHSGVTLAPLIGEVAVLEILDGARVDFVDAFRFDRFAEA